jgi:hypothetical protein
MLVSGVVLASYKVENVYLEGEMPLICRRKKKKSLSVTEHILS